MDLLNSPYFELTRYYMTNNSLHRHKKWEVCIFTQGTTSHSINGEDFTCGIGDVFFLGPPHIHSVCPVLQPHGHQDIYFFDEEFREICNTYPENIYEIATNGILHFHLSQIEMNIVLSSLQRISQLCLVDDPKTLKTCKTVTVSLLHYLIGQYILQQLHKTEKSFPPWFYEILSMLQDPENLCLSVDEIIKTTGYSHSQFSVLFKKYTSTSLIDFLMNKRLEYATELLTKTDKSTLDICMSLGYNSYSFFLKNFKKKYGMTPLQYRKKNSSIFNQNKS